MNTPRLNALLACLLFNLIIAGTATAAPGPARTSASARATAPARATTPGRTTVSARVTAPTRATGPSRAVSASGGATTVGRARGPASSTSPGKTSRGFVLEKPPFSATPHGQRLSAGVPVTDHVRATPTPHSKLGGYAGYTRSRGTQHHAGLDDPSTGPRATEVSRYYGTRPGVVTAAGPAYTSKGKYLGEKVVIKTQTPTATFESKTLHHKQVLVRKGDVVRSGDPIARGTGYGDQFKTKDAGGPHTHWELRKDGRLVNPVNGVLVGKHRRR